MDIHDAIGESTDQLRRQNPHVAGEYQKIDLPGLPRFGQLSAQPAEMRLGIPGRVPGKGNCASRAIDSRSG